MPVHNHYEWEAWNEERKAFKNRDTQGFKGDIVALASHIQKLIEFSPKDKAGWPTIAALKVIDNLQKDLQTFQRYLSQLR